MTSADLKLRTKEFAKRCVRLSSALPKNYLCNHIAGQLVRSSTSVASNYRASCIAISTKSFISKLSIAIEESDESLFWLEFTVEEALHKPDLIIPLKNEAAEITAILIASRKTAQIRQQQQKSNNK